MSSMISSTCSSSSSATSRKTLPSADVAAATSVVAVADASRLFLERLPLPATVFRNRGRYPRQSTWVCSLRKALCIRLSSGSNLLSRYLDRALHWHHFFLEWMADWRRSHFFIRQRSSIKRHSYFWNPVHGLWYCGLRHSTAHRSNLPRGGGNSTDTPSASSPSAPSTTKQKLEMMETASQKNGKVRGFRKSINLHCYWAHLRRRWALESWRVAFCPARSSRCPSRALATCSSLFGRSGKSRRRPYEAARAGRQFLETSAPDPRCQSNSEWPDRGQRQARAPKTALECPTRMETIYLHNAQSNIEKSSLF